MNADSYSSALQLSLDSDYIYHPNDGKIIDVSGIPGVKSYESEGKLVKPELFFNGSIVRYNGRIIMACRADQQPWWKKIRIMICELDRNYDPIPETARYLGLHAEGDCHHVEDPRLFVHNGLLMVTYTDGHKVYHSVIDDSLNVIQNLGVVTNVHFRASTISIRDKNFVPFSVDKSLYYSYLDSPRIILAPDGNVIIPEQSATWDYGSIRGGTPAIPYDNGKFISFFHSSLIVGDCQTLAGQRVYFMGAYTFSCSGNFKIEKMTRTPLMKGCIEMSGVPRPTNAFVVFPVGVIDEPDHYVVSYGYNDVNTRIIRVSKKLLNKELK